MPLRPGQTSTEHIQSLEKFLLEQMGADGMYKRLPDPGSLRSFGCRTTRPPVPVPRFTLVIDTAEPDHLFLVQKMRSMNWWAVAVSMKRPPNKEYNPNFYAGDFAALEWQDADPDEDSETNQWVVPCGYDVLWDAERKEIGDWISSFGDGRRERQRAEQALSTAKRHIFLVEGDPDQVPPERRRWVSALNTDLDHLTVDSPFVLRQIRSHADLISVLANFMRYSAQGIVESEKGIKKYVHHGFSGKTGPRVVDTPEALFSGMLQAVPGVSPAAAQAIHDNAFATTVDFARALVKASESPAEREALIQKLAAVQVPAQSASSKRATTSLGMRGQRIVDLMVPSASKSGIKLKLPSKKSKAPSPTRGRKRTAEESSDESADSSDWELPSRTRTAAASSSSSSSSLMWDSD